MNDKEVLERFHRNLKIMEKPIICRIGCGYSINSKKK